MVCGSAPRLLYPPPHTNTPELHDRDGERPGGGGAVAPVASPRVAGDGVEARDERGHRRRQLRDQVEEGVRRADEAHAGLRVGAARERVGADEPRKECVAARDHHGVEAVHRGGEEGVGATGSGTGTSTNTTTGTTKTTA